MPMSLFKNNKNRIKVVNPYCSLGWLLIITIFQKCAKLKPPWVHLGKQNNTIIFFFTIYFFNKKVDLSSLQGGAGPPIAPPPPPLRACIAVHCTRITVNFKCKYNTFLSSSLLSKSFCLICSNLNLISLANREEGIGSL